MYELKKIGKVFTSKFVGTGPSSYKKGLTKVEKHWSNIFNIIIEVFPFIKNTLHVSSHVPSKGRQIRLRFIGHCRIVGSPTYSFLLAPGIRKWLIKFWNICRPVTYTVRNVHINYSKHKTGSLRMTSH